jgi:hypothetical protein
MNGTFVRGSGIVSTTKLGTGKYQVQTTQDVTTCGPVAQVQAADSSTTTDLGMTHVYQTPGDPTSLTVETFRLVNGSVTSNNDEPFILHVAC